MSFRKGFGPLLQPTPSRTHGSLSLKVGTMSLLKLVLLIIAGATVMMTLLGLGYHCDFLTAQCEDPNLKLYDPVSIGLSLLFGLFCAVGVGAMLDL